MAKVAITEQYLTDIADAIREKTGLLNTFFPSEMAPAILTISGSGGITPTGTITITRNDTYDVARYASAVVNVPTGSTINNQNKLVTPTKSQQQITYDSGYTGLGTVTVNAIPANYIEPTGTLSITSNGTQDVTEYASVDVNVAGGGAEINNQDKTVNPTTSKQTITADSGYTGLGTVTVNAMPAGTAGTPTASKGTVTNHSISVTPSVTNTTGYITGGTVSGTAVTVSASELVSGTLSITTNGTKDVTNYASVNVNISSEAPVIESLNVTPSEAEQTFNAGNVDGYKPIVVAGIPLDYVGSGIDQLDSSDLTVSDATVTAPAGYYSAAASKSVASGTEGTPTASKGTVTNNSITVTPSVINTAGYISGGTHSGTAVTVSASELVSGTYSVTASGTHNVTNYASASVASGSATAPSTISGTTASVSTGTNTLTLTKTVSVTPTVSAGYVSSGTAGNSSVSLTANVTVNPTLTVSGPTVTAPAGYYTANASKSVATMTPPSEPSNNYTSGYTRLDVIDRATTTRYLNIPPGYNSTGVYYQISAVYDGSATTPATTITANPTITISSSGLITATTSASQNITPTVSAGYVSSGTAGTVTVSGSKTQQLTTKAAAIITPTTTNQTIAAGTYLTGTQTIQGDADLIGSNILATANIFGVQGTVTFQSYYTGSSAPASSLGNNGDIYLQG